MKQILALSNELIFQIRPVSAGQPEPQIGILWVLFPKAKSKGDDWTDYANQEPVWVGLLADRLAEYPQNEKAVRKHPQVVFVTGTALVNPRMTPLNFTLFNLSHQKCYRLKESCGQVILDVPSEGIVLPQPNDVRICSSKINQTVFVDPKYGNDRTGRVEQQLCPFKTIKAAMAAIPPRPLGEIWETHLSAGIFPEVAIIPSDVQLIGQSPMLTRIHELVIEGRGGSGAANLTVRPPPNRRFDSAVLKVIYNQPNQPVNAQVTLTNVNLQFEPLEIGSGELAVVDLVQQSGQQGNIVLRECQIEANLSKAPPATGYFMLVRPQNKSPPILGGNNNLNVEFRRSTFTFAAPNEVLGDAQLAVIRNLGANLSDVYGKHVLTSRPRVGFKQRFFVTEGRNFSQSHPTVELSISTLPIPPVWEGAPDYVLWQGIDVESTQGRHHSSSPDVVFSNVRQDKVLLAEVSGSRAQIQVLGASFSRGATPKVDVNNPQITYSTHDQFGSTTNAGPIAARIRRSSEASRLRPDDHSLVIDAATDVDLYHIPTVSQTQIVKGSLHTLINTLLVPVNVNGDIFGTPGVLTLQPLQTVQINADETQFYLTSSVTSPFSLNTQYPLTAGPLPVGPPGAGRIMINLAGASGGSISNGNQGGRGGSVSATLLYDPSNTYTVTLGTKGGNSPGSPGGGNGGSAGSSNGEGGGGYSSLSLNEEILLLAGGGGGAAKNSAGGNSLGNDGGAASGDGGGGGGSTTQGTPGTGGKGGSGGESGSNGGRPTPSNGGKGGNGAGGPVLIGHGGGGGGGGYYGGGGGGTSLLDGFGGGAGSSFAYFGASNVAYGVAALNANGSGFVIYLPPLPPKSLAYVAAGAGPGTGYIYAIDTASNTIIATISAESEGANGVAITPNGQYVYVTNTTGSVSVINTFTNTIVKVIPVGSVPECVVATPNGLYVYVTNYGDNTVSAIEIASNQIIATIGVGIMPIAIASSQDSAFIYVGNFGSNFISVIDTSTNKVTANIQLSEPTGTLAVTPDGQYLYVGAAIFPTIITVIDLSTNQITTIIQTESQAFGMAFTPDGRYLYVTGNTSNNVIKIDTATNTVLKYITAPPYPRGIAITPDGQFAYITNYDGSDTVTILDLSNDTVTGSINTCCAPIGIAIGLIPQ